MRVGVVSNQSETNEEFLQDLDDAGEIYQLNFTLDDIDGIE